MNDCNRLYVAPLSPMSTDMCLNLDAVEAQAACLLNRGAEGFYLCGGTGEGVLLTLEERMALVERWVRVVGRSAPIIVHVGHTCLDDACTLARHAARFNVAGFSTVGPMYQSVPVRDIEALVRWSASIAEAAPELPFFYYHLGQVAGLARVNIVEYLQRAIECIPNFAGLKFTHDNLMDYSRCLRLADGTHAVLYGRDEMMLSALSCGARGFVGGTFNLTSPLGRQIVDAYHYGRHPDARQAQATLQNLVAVFQRYGGLPAVKASLRLLGLALGPCRQPWTNPDPDQTKNLLREIENVWSQLAELPDTAGTRDHATLEPRVNVRSDSMSLHGTSR
ncbi:MAG: dihydrodipicolinate synthase family protein [Phycisphaeraceae bacterium]|nr:dihydrodipicolinate synthase family protein [Phycisphaeraceae bacterium]